jgi:ribosomal protein L37AE/L43A
MPIDTKPSRNEDEYFARENAELINSLRAQRDREREATERAAHLMRCPRCGGKLEERRHHKVTVDVCASCGGTWLDKGELEMLEHVDRNAFRRFIGDLLGLKE